MSHLPETGGTNRNTVQISAKTILGYPSALCIQLVDKPVATFLGMSHPLETGGNQPQYSLNIRYNPTVQCGEIRYKRAIYTVKGESQ